MHLVTLRHFRSRDKDGGYTIRSVVAENSMLPANVMALCFIEPELVMARRILHSGNRNIRFFFAPVTLTLTR